MQEVVSRNIRGHRENRSWTQAQLASAAGLQIRTVQRAEAGMGISSETLQAIAGALDVELDDLRVDSIARAELARALGVEPHEVTADLLAKRIEEELAKHTKVPLHRISTSSDLRHAWGGFGFVFSCEISDDRIQDAVATLKEMMVDIGDVADEIGATSLRQAEASAFECIESLAQLGCAVAVGTEEMDIGHGAGNRLRGRVTFVVIASNDECPKVLLLDPAQVISL
ncbi:MAG: helix-turn-helix transcriptional regulator [Polyangiales bacterium]|nr:helix-turn-helix transcriptional regulator [Myxococcales bacterium]